MSNGNPLPGRVATCGVPGSDYCCYSNRILITEPAGLHYFLDTRTLYFTSLVHAGVFSVDFSNAAAAHWQQTVTQGSSLHATCSADALLAGVDFGIMTIHMDTAEAQWFTGGSVTGDTVSDALSTEFGEVADFTSLSDGAIVISDKIQNR